MIPKKDRKKKVKYPTLEKFIDKKITGVLECFNFERDFVFECKETNDLYENFHYLGIKLPIGKKDHL